MSLSARATALEEVTKRTSSPSIIHRMNICSTYFPSDNYLLPYIFYASYVRLAQEIVQICIIPVVNKYILLIQKTLLAFYAVSIRLIFNFRELVNASYKSFAAHRSSTALVLAPLIEQSYCCLLELQIPNSNSLILFQYIKMNSLNY